MASTDSAHSDALSAALIPLGSHAAAAPIELKRPVTLIGSRKDIVRLHLQSSTVSKAHCAIVHNTWGCYVHDLGSRIGTLVNGKPITDHDLADGDVLQVGRFQFRYRAPTKVKSRPEPLPAADLTVSTLDRPLAVHKRVIVIGRRVGSDVQFDDSRVSNIHALIVEQDNRRLVRDLTSRTGTWLDDKPVHQEPLADGAMLKIGGATLSIRDSAIPAARGPDAPLTLAEAAPAAAIGLDAPLAGDADPLEPDLADLDLGKLDLETSDFELEPDDTIPADDLAALRRNWTAPARPVDDAPSARPTEHPVEPVTPAEAKSDEPPLIELPLIAPEPIELEPLQLEPPEAPAARLPADAEPIVVDSAVAEPITDPITDPAEAVDTDDAGEPAVAGVQRDSVMLDQPELDALDLDALELAEAEAPELDALDLSDIELELDDDAPLADAPLAGTALAGTADAKSDTDAAEIVADPDAPVVEHADAPVLTELSAERSANDAATPDVALDISPVTASADTVDVTAPIDLSDVALKPELDVVEAIDVASEPATLDLDGPVVPHATPDQQIDLADEVRLSDTGKPVESAGQTVSDTSPDAAAPAVSTDADVPWTTPAAADAVMDADIDLIDLKADLKADELADSARDEAAAVSAFAAEAPTPAEAAAETVVTPPEPIADRIAADSRVDAPTPDDFVIAGLPDEEDAATDAEEAAALPDAAVGPEAPAVEPVAERDALDLPATEPLIPAAFVEPPDALIEPDLIRLGDEIEDDNSDATALAVDLGLVLEDDHHDLSSGLAEPMASARAEAPAPAEPVEIDLTTARLAEPPRRDSIDLSHLGRDTDAPTFLNGFTTPHAAPSADLSTGAANDAGAGEDLFDVDAIDADERTDASDEKPDESKKTAGDTAEDTAEGTGNPRAEADDEIGPPQGGSLADLMPSGPPLLGGSFMSIPHMAPPTPADLGGRRRPLRVGFGQESRPAKAAPFAAERTIADALGGVDGDATLDDFVANSPGVASIDAFSGAPAAATNGVARHTDPHTDSHADLHAEPTFEAEAEPAGAAEQFLAPVEKFRPRGVIRAALPATQPAGSAVLDVAGSSVIPFAGNMPSGGASEHDLNRAARHKRRVRRVITCLVAMILLIGGAAAGVYYFLPIKSTVDALISFDGLDRLGTDEAKLFRVRQDAALVSEAVRQKAVQSLRQPLPSGFLGDGKQIYETLDRDPKVRWPSEQPTVMRLRVRSPDKENDIVRVRALGDTFVKFADTDRSQITTLREKIRVDEGQIIQRRMQIGDLSDQLQALQQASSNRSNLKDPSALNAEFLAAEPALTTIKSRRQELEATLVRLKLPASAVATPAVDPVAADDELAKLTRQLTELQQPAARPEATAAGAEARKTLDESIAQFQKDLAAAGKLRDNPQLTAYVEAANGMFTQFREMTESFIRRQENNRTRLSELKSTLSDKMQARTQELLETDNELKKIKDALAILERQHNAAIGQGSPQDLKNAQKSELEMRLLRVKVGEREDKFKNDTGYSEAITGIQSVIDASEKESRADRRSIDERLTALQSDFVKNAPAVEKMPAEQKALAEGFEAKLAAMNDARRAYDAAAEKSQADAKATEAAASEKVAGLRLQVAARRQDVLAAVRAKQAEDDEATRKTRLAAAQTELDNVRQQEQAAQHRVADAAAAIEAAEKQRRVVAQSDADRQTKQAQRDAAERDLRTVQGQIATRQAQLARLIVPDPKVEMQVYDDVDRRPLIAGLAGGAIALLLLIPIVLDLLALSRESHPHHPTGTTPAEAAGGFEPVLTDTPPRKALPEPASA